MNSLIERLFEHRKPLTKDENGSVKMCVADVIWRVLLGAAIIGVPVLVYFLGK